MTEEDRERVAAGQRGDWLLYWAMWASAALPGVFVLALLVWLIAVDLMGAPHE